MLDRIRGFGGWLRATVAESPFWFSTFAVMAVLALDALIGGPLWPLLFAVADGATRLGERYPPLMALYLTLSAVLITALIVRLLILYINHSNVTGEEITFHGAMDRIWDNPMALGIVVAGFILGVFDFAGRLASGGG